MFGAARKKRVHIVVIWQISAMVGYSLHQKRLRYLKGHQICFMRSFGTTNVKDSSHMPTYYINAWFLFLPFSCFIFVHLSVREVAKMQSQIETIPKSPRNIYWSCKFCKWGNWKAQCDLVLFGYFLFPILRGWSIQNEDRNSHLKFESEHSMIDHSGLIFLQ